MTSSSLKRERTVVRAGAFQSTWATNSPSGSAMVKAATPPTPPGPWQLAQPSSKVRAPLTSKRPTQSIAAFSCRAGSISQYMGRTREIAARVTSDQARLRSSTLVSSSKSSTCGVRLAASSISDPSSRFPIRKLKSTYTTSPTITKTASTRPIVRCVLAARIIGLSR